MIPTDGLHCDLVAARPGQVGDGAVNGDELVAGVTGHLPSQNFWENISMGSGWCTLIGQNPSRYCLNGANVYAIKTQQKA